MAHNSTENGQMGTETESEAAPECPRCGSTNTTVNPETDVPGATPAFGCEDCLYLWDDGPDLSHLSEAELAEMLGVSGRDA